MVDEEREVASDASRQRAPSVAWEGKLCKYALRRPPAVLSSIPTYPGTFVCHITLSLLRPTSAWTWSEHTADVVYRLICGWMSCRFQVNLQVSRVLLLLRKIQMTLWMSASRFLFQGRLIVLNPVACWGYARAGDLYDVMFTCMSACGQALRLSVCYARWKRTRGSSSTSGDRHLFCSNTT